MIANRLALLVKQDDLRLQLITFGRRTPIDNDFLSHASGIIGLFAHRDAVDQIHMFCQTGLIGNNRQRIWVPLKQFIAPFDLLTDLNKQLRTIAQLVTGALFTLLIDHQQLHVPANNQNITN